MIHSVVQGLVTEAKAKGTVKSITLEVGELVSTTHNQLQDLFKKMTDWDITIIPKRALVQCVCGFYGTPILEKAPDKITILCPVCGSTPGIISGEEISLKNVQTD
ncbi:MAG: hydrogenase/urease maturation nickel metallochaperone HypA [Nanoarchaeota archaeon]